MPLLSKSKVNDAHEFKPILAELEDEPVSVAARSTFWLTFATAMFFLGWSIVGEIDVVVTAPGKVIPAGHSKLVQPLDSGVISKIHVREGDRVRKGQRLIEIDPTVTGDELYANQRNYRHTSLEIQRLQSTLQGGQFNAGSDGESAAQVLLFQSARAGLEKQLLAKQEELSKTLEQQKQTNAQLDRSAELLKIASTKHDRLTDVVDIISKDEWEKNQSDIATYTTQVDEAQHKLEELNHDQERLRAEIEKIKADFSKDNLQELSQKQKEATDLSGKVRELSFKHAKQCLVSPVDGYVDAVYVHTVGGVVSAGEKLMSIVPTSGRAVVTASVSNKDIGFVHIGMPVQIKADAFDFQKYGMYQGKVVLISKDSHDDERKQPSQEQGPEKKLEQVYEVYVEPTGKSLTVEGKQEQLAPGMTVVAEIKTGKRRIIEFFIYPLIKYWQEGTSVR